MEEVVFRYSVARICIVAFVLTVPALTIALATSGLSVDAILMGCLTAVIFDAIFIGLIAWIFPVKVNVQGIRGQSSLGSPIQMSWEEMETARRINILGFPYWIVKAKNRTIKLWMLEMFVNDVSIVSVVREFAPEENPLRVAMEQKEV